MPPLPPSVAPPAIDIGRPLLIWLFAVIDSRPLVVSKPDPPSVPAVQVVVPETVSGALPVKPPPVNESVVRLCVWPVDRLSVPLLTLALVGGVLIAVVKLAAAPETLSAEPTFTIVPLKLTVPPLSSAPPETS